MPRDAFMRRCLELAEEGRGRVGNGALVGAVVVRDGAIIGEGKFEGPGSDHAETAAIKSVQKIDSKDVLFVSLEPCVPHPSKKTPGCAPRIIESGITHVVIGMEDPDPRVAGKGVEALRAAGITVTMSDLRAECEWMNRGYVSVRTKNRPWITLKQALTPDGRIANDDGSPLKITDKAQDEWSHTFLRATHDAILVGVGTVTADDPSLNTRFDQKKRQYQAWRVVLDPHLRIPIGSRLINDDHYDRTILICGSDHDQHSPVTRQLKEWGIHVVAVDLQKPIHAVLDALMAEPFGITSILVEGGKNTWERFRTSKMYDADVMLIGQHR